MPERKRESHSSCELQPVKIGGGRLTSSKEIETPIIVSCKFICY